MFTTLKSIHASISICHKIAAIKSKDGLSHLDRSLLISAHYTRIGIFLWFGFGLTLQSLLSLFINTYWSSLRSERMIAISISLCFYFYSKHTPHDFEPCVVISETSRSSYCVCRAWSLKVGLISQTILHWNSISFHCFYWRKKSGLRSVPRKKINFA